MAQVSLGLCQECDELRSGVPGLCPGMPGLQCGKRCKRLILKDPIHPKTG
jgi:hypothetical protein